VIRFDPGLLVLFTPIGFLMLSAWIAAMGVAFLSERNKWKPSTSHSP